MLTATEAAEVADVKPAQLKLWLESGAFKTSMRSKTTSLFGWTTAYFFNEDDVQRLRKFATEHGKRRPTKAAPFVDDGAQSDFTVAQIASMWQLSTDTIQRLFQDEPGVVTLGNKNPRGKRKRITLRIPREVMERVKRRRSNPK